MTAKQLLIRLALLLHLSAKPVPSRKPRCGRRNCAKCNKPIRRHDKWQFSEQGPPQHRNCASPESYDTEAPAVTAQQELLQKVEGA